MKRKPAITSAEITRRVKAVVAGYVAAGVMVTGGRVTFQDGEPSVEVITQAPAPAHGAILDDAEKLKNELDKKRRNPSGGA